MQRTAEDAGEGGEQPRQQRDASSPSGRGCWACAGRDAGTGCVVSGRLKAVSGLHSPRGKARAWRGEALWPVGSPGFPGFLRDQAGGQCGACWDVGKHRQWDPSGGTFPGPVQRGKGLISPQKPYGQRETLKFLERTAEGSWGAGRDTVFITLALSQGLSSPRLEVSQQKHS